MSEDLSMIANLLKKTAANTRSPATRLVTVLTLSCLVLLGTITSAWAWPTDSQWIPVPKGGSAIQDPQSDAQGSRNVVPDDGTNPAAYIFNDGVNIYFRFRLDADPTGSGSGSSGNGLLQQYGWGFEIDTDQNADDYEWLMMLDGITKVEVIRLMENTVKSQLGDPSDTAEDVIAPYPLAGNYRITMAETCFDSQNNPLGACDTATAPQPYDYQDYYLDYKIPYSVFKAATGITDTTIIRFFVGSSSSANNLTENGADLVAGSDLYEMASDFITPFGYLPSSMTFYDGQVRFVDDLNGAFDTNIAAPGDTLYIRVDDRDLNALTNPSETIVVTITSPTGDAERVTLYSTGVQGKYTGSLPTSGSGNSGGSLYILSGQTATVTYVDAIAANEAQSVDRTDTIFFTSTGTDLAISKSVNDDAPIEGDTVTFTITVMNNGPTATSSATISDILPAGQLTYQSHTATQGTYSNATGDWSLSSGLAVGSFATLTIDAYIEPGTKGLTLTNTGSITASVPTDNYAANNSSSASVKVGGTDLRVTKSVNEALPLEGDSIVYTIRTLNLGPANTSGVQVTDLLPSGVTYVSHTVNQGTYTSGTGLWDIGNLNSGNGALLQITATVDSGTTGQIITNTANLTATDQPDTNSTNNSASANIKVEYLDLILEKEVRRYSPSTTPYSVSVAADVGDTVEFRITVDNNGPHDASGIEVTDTIPAGLTYVVASASVSTGSYDGTTGIWTLGSLNDKDNATLIFRGTIDTGTEGQTLINEAEITEVDQPDSNPGNEYSTASVTVDGTDLQIFKSVSNSTPNVGDTITWTIQVQNNGPNQATNILVTDLLPDGVSYVKSQGKVIHTVTQGSFDSSGTWDVGTLETPPTTPYTATLTFDTTVDTGTTGETITNNAFITAADQADPEDSNNIASEFIAVGGTDLEITKTVDDSTPNVGQDVIYTLTVTNNGPSAATNVAVNDLLPPELSYESDSPSQGTYDSVTGVWSINNLANAASVTLTITATVLKEDDNLVITNTAEVTATEADQDTSNNIATADITVNATDLSASKTVNNATPPEGTNIIYTISVTNNGANSATNVELEDLLPSGVTYVSSTPSQGAYSAGLWSIGTLAGSSSASLTIVASVDSGTEGLTITNTAALDTSVLDQIDTDVTNDSSSVDIVPQAALALPIFLISKGAVSYWDPVNGTSSPYAIPGGVVQYTLTVTNTGLGSPDNNSIIITDPIPANTELVVTDPVVTISNVVADTGLTISYVSPTDNSDDIYFSTDGADFTYQPTADANGADTSVTHIRVNPQGEFSTSDGSTLPSFSLSFKVRIK